VPDDEGRGGCGYTWPLEDVFGTRETSHGVVQCGIRSLSARSGRVLQQGRGGDGERERGR
jgi:hypothetical protein